MHHHTYPISCPLYNMYHHWLHRVCMYNWVPQIQSRPRPNMTFGPIHALDLLDKIVKIYQGKE
mgnify:CR=1 FL=1